jgi:hypothetical protein
MMKAKRICAMPFTMLADLVTLGNMGGRSFTQQLFDAEQREQSIECELALVEIAARMLSADHAGKAGEGRE